MDRQTIVSYTLIMNQKNSQSINYHRRAASDSAYNRKKGSIATHQEENQQLRKLDQEQSRLIQTVKDLIEGDSRFGKTEKIRVQQWSLKLAARPHNATWRKNIIFYLKVLAETIKQGILTHPFAAVPTEGPLPNLKLLDLPYPIRRIFDDNQKQARQSSNKSRHQNESVERLYKKSKSINFNEEVQLDFQDFDDSNIKKHIPVQTRKYTSIKSCQVSGKREQNYAKWNMNDLKLKLTAEDNKENHFNSFNSSSITRRLFENEEKSKEQEKLLTYNSDRIQIHNKTVCSFENFDSKISIKMMGIQLLSRVFQLIRSEDFSQDEEAQTLCLHISKLAEEMGVALSNENANESIMSQSSASLIRASENMRLKFSETDEETLQFMSFLHKLRVKNQ